MHDEMEFTDDMSKEMIEHLRKHFQLLDQRQGKDIMQNFFVIDRLKRHPAIRELLENMRELKQDVIDDIQASLLIQNIAESHIVIINSILSTMPDTGDPLDMRGLDIPKLRKLAERNSIFIVLGCTKVIEAWKKDIQKYPDTAAEMIHHIDTAEHVLLDFVILLSLESVTSTRYLKAFKEKHGIQ